MNNEPSAVLIDEILQYFTSHPEAGDSVQGIACWWLKEQHYGDSIENIQQVLNLLEDCGAVVRIELPDGNSFYRSGPALEKGIRLQ